MLRVDDLTTAGDLHRKGHYEGACAVASDVALTPCRRSVGDRGGVAGQGRRYRSPTDRGHVGTTGFDGAGLPGRWTGSGIGAAVGRVAEGRRLDGESVERVLFALVAQRALEAGSKLAATGWVAERVAIEGLSGFSDDQAYRGMDFLLEALEEIAGEIFASVAHLLNLDLDLVFVDTTSTYFEAEGPDLLPELQDDDPNEGSKDAGEESRGNPVESGRRAFGHSKYFRADLPQVVIAMAVTRDGVPVRAAGRFPGTSPTPRSSAPSRTTSARGTCAGWCG